MADEAAEATGMAVVVDGAEFAEFEALIKSKYGFMVTVITAMNSARLRSENGYLVGLPGPSKAAMRGKTRGNSWARGHQQVL